MFSCLSKHDWAPRRNVGLENSKREGLDSVFFLGFFAPIFHSLSLEQLKAADLAPS